VGHGLRPSRFARLLTLAVVVALAGACQNPPPKRYPLHGQILAVDAPHQQLIIKHDDIPGFMPGMTMTYPVARPALMQGRAAGEIVNATLAVSDATGVLVDIQHAGTAPLPEGTNVVAMATDLLGVGDAMPDVALIDEQNKRRSLSEWKGTTTVITFIYTRCPLPNFCPLMDQNFEVLQRDLASDPALRGHVKLISVTIDPAYDTPAVLAAHASHVKANPAVWTFLTGDVHTIDHLAAQFGVGVLRDPQQATNITHNLRTTLIGADGKIRKIYSGNDWKPSDVLADLKR
jgi:protein SCO1/2